LLGIRMCDEPLSLSCCVVSNGLLAGMSDPARKLSEVISRINGAAAAIVSIKLIDREPQIVDPPKSLPLARHPS